MADLLTRMMVFCGQWKYTMKISGRRTFSTESPCQARGVRRHLESLMASSSSPVEEVPGSRCLPVPLCMTFSLKLGRSAHPCLSLHVCMRKSVHASVHVWVHVCACVGACACASHITPTATPNKRARRTWPWENLQRRGDRQNHAHTSSRTPARRAAARVDLFACVCGLNFDLADYYY